MRKVHGMYLVVLLLVIAGIHFGAVAVRHYDSGKVWIDIPLHALGGMFFALLFLWAAGNTFPMRSVRERFVVSMAIIGAAVIGSVLWEVFEFALLTLAPSLAQTAKWYSLRVSDVLSDLFAGLVGGMIAASLAVRWQR